MLIEQITTWVNNNGALINLLTEATGQTLYMVFASGLIGFAIGIPLGVMLHVTKKRWPAGAT